MSAERDVLYIWGETLSLREFSLAFAGAYESASFRSRMPSIPSNTATRASELMKSENPIIRAAAVSGGRPNVLPILDQVFFSRTLRYIFTKEKQRRESARGRMFRHVPSQLIWETCDPGIIYQLGQAWIIYDFFNSLSNFSNLDATQIMSQFCESTVLVWRLIEKYNFIHSLAFKVEYADKLLIAR